MIPTERMYISKAISIGHNSVLHRLSSIKHCKVLFAQVCSYIHTAPQHPQSVRPKFFLSYNQKLPTVATKKARVLAQEHLGFRRCCAYRERRAAGSPKPTRSLVTRSPQHLYSGPKPARARRGGRDALSACRVTCAPAGRPHVLRRGNRVEWNGENILSGIRDTFKP